jgi:5-formyltetrahydrofolate cyclo-ligase
VPAVAIAFAVQLVPEVPTGGTDRRVDVIVTEAEVVRCRP